MSWDTFTQIMIYHEVNLSSHSRPHAVRSYPAFPTSDNLVSTCSFRAYRILISVIFISDKNIGIASIQPLITNLKYAYSEKKNDLASHSMTITFKMPLFTWDSIVANFHPSPDSTE